MVRRVVLGAWRRWKSLGACLDTPEEDGGGVEIKIIVDSLGHLWK